MKNLHNIETKKNFDGTRTGYSSAGTHSSVYWIKGKSGSWVAYPKTGNGPAYYGRTLEEISKKLCSC